MDITHSFQHGLKLRVPASHVTLHIEYLVSPQPRDILHHDNFSGEWTSVLLREVSQVLDPFPCMRKHTRHNGALIHVEWSPVVGGCSDWRVHDSKPRV